MHTSRKILVARVPETLPTRTIHGISDVPLVLLTALHRCITYCAFSLCWTICSPAWLLRRRKSRAPMGGGKDHPPGDHGRHVPPNVIVKFIVPYETTWGQIVLLTGSRGLLGGGTIERGLKMACASGPGGLLWETSLIVPNHYECEYEYIVYNEHSNQVVRRESSSHYLKVSASMAGSCLLIKDHFKVKLNASCTFSLTSSWFS